MSDSDVWDTIDPQHLWVCDKLLLAKRLGYLCGPAGVTVPSKGMYIVRPCVNFRMMSRGAEIVELDPNQDSIPDGYFWCEVFTGRHLSFDYRWGQQVLAVEGFRNSTRLDRFSRWEKVTDQYVLPTVLQQVAENVEWFNVEVIGSNVIEAHFRFNDDFANHDGDVVIPIWKEQFYRSECGDRVGFIVENSGRMV